MGGVRLSVERLSAQDTQIVESPARSGYYTTGEQEEAPLGSRLYSPSGLVMDGEGLFLIPGIAYTGFYTDNVKGYSIVEDATTINAGNFSGGFGQLSVQINTRQNLLRALSDNAMIQDAELGKVTGTVKDITSEDGNVTLTGDSLLGLLNTARVVKPFTGTLGDAMTYYLGLVAMPAPLHFDESEIAERHVDFPGWTGNLWDHIKQMLVAQEVEMSQVFDTIVIRHLRTFTSNTARHTTFGFQVNNQTAARTVEVKYYPTEYRVQGEYYPVPGDEEPTVYQVDANETMTVTLQLPHSLSSVNQPTCVDFVYANRDYSGTTGVYSVAGNDGLPVTPAQWKAQGGDLRVKLTDDPSVVEMIISGPNNTTLAPFRIAMSSGEFYNSLHLTGTGVFQDEEMVTVFTGSTSDVTGEAVGVTVENRFIQTAAQAYSLAAKVAGGYALTYTVNGNAFGVNRTKDTRELVQAWLQDFDAYAVQNYPIPPTIADFDGDWSSFAEWDEYWTEWIQNVFANQAFGNVAGSRVRIPEAFFRIDTATISPEGVQFSGSVDTLVDDFDTEWGEAPRTLGDISLAWDSTATLNDFSIAPLRGPDA